MSKLAQSLNGVVSEEVEERLNRNIPGLAEDLNSALESLSFPKIKETLEKYQNVVRSAQSSARILAREDGLNNAIAQVEELLGRTVDVPGALDDAEKIELLKKLVLERAGQIFDVEFREYSDGREAEELVRETIESTTNKNNPNAALDEGWQIALQGFNSHQLATELYTELSAQQHGARLLSADARYIISKARELGQTEALSESFRQINRTAAAQGLVEYVAKNHPKILRQVITEFYGQNGELALEFYDKCKGLTIPVTIRNFMLRNFGAGQNGHLTTIEEIFDQYLSELGYG